jgi:hypothetical protein
MRISATDVDDEEADVFLVERLVQDASAVWEAVQDPSHAITQSHSHDVFKVKGIIIRGIRITWEIQVTVGSMHKSGIG